MNEPVTVGEAGERSLLRQILEEFSPAVSAEVGPGDDAAVLRFNGDAVVTTDAMIQGPDFRLAWHSGYELGWKLAATNLSDVAAMGATPTALTVTLAAPPSLPVGYLTEVARGLNAACAHLAPGCGVVGGDLSTADQLMFSITALGQLEGRRPVLRSGARPGDTVAYAGTLGLAGMGLALLFAECSRDGEATAEGLEALRLRHPAEIGAQLTPNPPIALGVAAANGGATAMMDISDSLSLDAARMARASGVRMSLVSAALGEQPHAALTGGEDHGLLATFPPGALVPEGFRVLGEVLAQEAEGACDEVLVDGHPFTPQGWDPYRGLQEGAFPTS